MESSPSPFTTALYIPYSHPAENAIIIPPHLHFFLNPNFSWDNEACTTTALRQLFQAFYPGSIIHPLVPKESLHQYFELFIMIPYISQYRHQFNYTTNTFPMGVSGIGPFHLLVIAT